MLRLQQHLAESEDRSAELEKQVFELENLIDAERQRGAEERDRYETNVRADEEMNERLREELERQRNMMMQLEEATGHNSDAASYELQENIREKDRTIKVIFLEYTYNH
ncbi:hydroxyproline-rich glycoprotein precursor, putative [Perkinsus marinus ATCC 50983]|uniref:Hydroxyproline-rich glycoprotein, putative n=1 Tax=Perkinsus marinus (strain ATCC 50983 / TXsc) TaxID=423536 RepID=C5L9J4_PERM5|nr:hydroxyproline-rich glycoprotein precursor, putative [Perkinsus marinus ATCC 50983]EER06587.1 hydroxyproline-rich glycoprotein precursor, putative [Perkinsus marinus ATCC 50983]|eukprot:XP_002774771.1 hydroxyproline-rich glycoprotein precursor, putative [Perkinsus marinus ATCC 50983]